VGATRQQHHAYQPTSNDSFGIGIVHVVPQVVKSNHGIQNARGETETRHVNYPTPALLEDILGAMAGPQMYLTAHSQGFSESLAMKKEQMKKETKLRG
jgi:hypothetical protein